MAQYLKRQNIQRIALMGDNGGFGRDGVAQVKALARAYGFTITDEFIFSPTSTSFAAELARVRNSNAQALWMWTVTPAGNTIVKEFRQLQLPQRLVLTGGNLSSQFLEATCPDVNGALVNSFLGVVSEQLPRGNPIRARAQIVQRATGKPLSVFHGRVDVDVRLEGRDGAWRIHRQASTPRSRRRSAGWRLPVADCSSAPGTTAGSRWTACGPEESSSASRGRCSEGVREEIDESRTRVCPTPRASLARSAALRSRSAPLRPSTTSVSGSSRAR